MKNDLQKLAELDRTIHEPARLMIVSLLYLVREGDFLSLLRQTGLSKGNLSSHLARLEEAGYVRIHKTYRGKTPLTLCSLTPAGRAAFEQYRKKLRAGMDAVGRRQSAAAGFVATVNARGCRPPRHLAPDPGQAGHRGPRRRLRRPRRVE